MDISAEHTGDQSIALTGRLEFDTAVKALELVSVRISEVEQLTVDLAGITTANSAGLALMAEWKALAHAGGKSISFRNVPPSLLKIAEICQLEHLLAS